MSLAKEILNLLLKQELALLYLAELMLGIRILVQLLISKTA
ncbi:hypothetical protein O164_26920 [Pseudomonas taiwanensis SJ9]|uniref:Uncharacterized protein n=1 Tax=Pseudomonas taiwanensis SJ9 TaxID=1388762 RepID=V7D743_9PSED|nr:hypothetical protein O164_26920 [Pseudomonas taiwanensis SJ9]